MSELPILFTTPMVRAILEGRKTQTRRLFKGLTPPDCPGVHSCVVEDGFAKFHLNGRLAMHSAEWTKCHHGQPGDRLWVRETFQFVRQRKDGQRFTFKSHSPFEIGPDQWIEYAATPKDQEPPPTWRPSIHIPRWASRITLEIVSVRVERLHEISEADAVAEGIERLSHGWKDYSGKLDCQLGQAVSSYFTLWESINGPGSWDANPWVWVVEFKHV